MTTIRDATLAEAAAIASLIQDLAQSMGETSPITPAYVNTYLAFPGCRILLAEEDGQIAGLLSYSIRPNLYHNGDTALIEELIVKSAWRNQGVGSALLEALLPAWKRRAALRCLSLPCRTIKLLFVFTAPMDWWMRRSTGRST